jgi:SAM-dependent methyltransferase
MNIIGGEFGYRLLKWIAPGGTRPWFDPCCANGTYFGSNKVEQLFGAQIWEDLRDKVVLDFGCGGGDEAIDIARHGARCVVGLDIQEEQLKKAAERASSLELSHRVRFCTHWADPVDAIISIDAFEHFGDPQEVLRVMHSLLKPGGRAYISFGPTWYHPFGGHRFSAFPFAHLLVSERALIRWRSDFKHDGATRFGEVEGGLNQMTIARFERLVEASSFACEILKAVPIRKLRFIANRWTRECTTAIVQAQLVKPE